MYYFPEVCVSWTVSCTNVAAGTWQQEVLRVSAVETISKTRLGLTNAHHTYTPQNVTSKQRDRKHILYRILHAVVCLRACDRSVLLCPLIPDDKKDDFLADALFGSIARARALPTRVPRSSPQRWPHTCFCVIFSFCFSLSHLAEPVLALCVSLLLS